MRIMAHFQWVVGVWSEVTNAITPPSPTGGGKNPSAMCLFGLCRKISGELLGGRKSSLVGEVNGRQWSWVISLRCWYAKQTPAWEGKGLFSEQLIVPKGSEACASVCSAVRAGQWRNRGTTVLQSLWRACKSRGAGTSSPSRLHAVFPSCRWRDGWTDGQAQHCPVRVPEGLRKYCVPKEGLCTPRMLLRGAAASSPSQRWGNWGTKHFSN